MTVQSVGIIGVGGVGGYFGGKLCRAAEPEWNVTFLARGAHLNAIRENGLTVETVKEGRFTCHPAIASDSIEQLPELDFCLISVKGYDLEQVVTALKNRVTRGSLILPLLNGIDIDARIRGLLPDAIVLPGCAYISSHIESPGKIAQTGGPCKIIFGRDPYHPDTSPEEVTGILKKAGILFEWTENPYSKIWEKFLFIAPFSLVTACFDKTIGEVIASPVLTRTVRTIMEEIVALAGKEGVPLPEGAADAAFDKARGFPPDTRTSFQQDFARPDRRDEREIFGKTILRLCMKADLPCDATREVYRRLNEIKPLPA